MNLEALHLAVKSVEAYARWWMCWRHWCFQRVKMVGCLTLCELWPAFDFGFVERKAHVQSKREVSDFPGF
jgi:hypothetical protein